MSKTATIRAQQRWEYMSISRKTDTYLAGELNTLGQDGWELVTINYARGKKEEMFWTAFLKRPATGHAATGTAQDAASAGQDPAAAQSSTATTRSFESLEGMDLEGDMFAIHEEPDEKKPPESEQGTSAKS